MTEALKKGELFAPETVKDLFNKVSGHSTIAKLAGTMPVAFNGNEIFTFSMDDEVNIVAEGTKKSAGSMKVEPIKVIPIKVEYGARVTDEFLYASEEKQLEILKAFNEGYAKKVARGLDIMSMHGVNPRTKELSIIIGQNSFDTNPGVVSVTYEAENIEGNIEDAIAVVDEAYDVTGMAMAKNFSATLAKLTVNGVKQYPSLAWGANPGNVNGLATDVNSTVSFNGSNDKAIIGDFANAFKWGFAKEIPLEVIKYGDPDQSGKDLKAYNQVYLRCETYIGWAIMDPAAFAVIEEKYNLTYDKNGGTGTMENGSYHDGDTVTVAANGFTGPSSKTFSEWNTEADGTGTSYDPADTFAMPSSNLTLYAIWA